MKAEKEVRGLEPCPCGSGQTYSQCCKRRLFKWVRDPEGNLAKSFHLSDELVKELKEQEKRFQETFGRKHRRDDPVFFEQYYVSRRDLKRESLRLMRATGVPPAIIYASKITDRMVTDDRREALSTEEEKEWNAAIDEFYERIDAGEDPDDLLWGDAPPEFLSEHIRKNQIVAGYFIDRHFNRFRKRSGANRNVEMVAAFATTNFARTLKSIHILLEKDVGFDAYPLLRTLYENFLVLKYLYYRPQDVETLLAQLGTFLGTHVLATNKSGVPIQSQIIEIATGKKIFVPSRWQMASALGELDQEIYNQIYQRLSAYCHSDITNIRYFISDRGFDYLSPDFSFDVLMVCHLLSMLFFACLKLNSPCAKYLKRDLSMNIERSLYAIVLMDRFFAHTSERSLPEIYKSSVAHVIEQDARARRVHDAIRESIEEVHGA